MESIATSSVSNILSTWYGNWEGKYEDCTNIVKKSIQKQIQQSIWSRGHFPGVNITSDIEFREEITKVYMAQYTATKYIEMVKQRGSFRVLLKTRGQDKKVVPQSLQQKWKQKEEILETDLPTDFTMIKTTSTYPYLGIQSTEKNKQPCIFAFRVPMTLGFIPQLRNSHSLLPTRETKYKERGTHTSRHYAVWADYSVTPYMSNEFLEDCPSAIEWAKLNKTLFNYLADELKLRDPTTFIKMKDTPQLDNIIWYKGLNLGQNAKMAIKRRKRKEETSSDWEDEEEVKLQKVGGLWHGLAVNEGQRKSGKLHKDYVDAKEAFNCIIPYGAWQGGEIIVWDLK